MMDSLYRKRKLADSFIPCDKLCYILLNKCGELSEKLLIYAAQISNNLNFASTRELKESLTDNFVKFTIYLFISRINRPTTFI